MKLRIVNSDKYYKYKCIPWTQPFLTENGTVGGDTYGARAISFWTNGRMSDEPYMAFDNNPKLQWAASNGHTGLDDWLEFYSPVIIKPTLITMTNRPMYNRVFNELEIQGSFDGVEYFPIQRYTNTVNQKNEQWEIPVQSPKYTKFVRIYGLNKGIQGINDSSHKNTTITTQEMRITATEKTDELIPGTPDDYDIVRAGGFGIVKILDKMYAINR